ncbi:MAG: class I SAM-dependent methyltransferase [Acidimicrobiia bacterium]|nr:class I SAM-dependent methyltransferase [Acidimicrobiia bacterium]
MESRQHLGAGPDHWDAVHRKRDPDQLTWFQPMPRLSLGRIERSGVEPFQRIVDIGGGSSLLCDALIERGYRDVTVVDISGAALTHVEARLQGARECVTLIEGDVGTYRGDRRFDLWHDRAVFHFLTEDDERDRYMRTMESNLAEQGHVVMATFGLQGPYMCSGLPVRRYGPESLAAALGGRFHPVTFEEELHATPAGGTQHFLYGLFRRVD